MLKINKTKPYQFRKVHDSSNLRRIYASRAACAAALICGIVPSLALLTYYNPYAQKTYAAETNARTLSDISTMQEMTTDICTNSKKHETNILRDTRDNNEYKVTRADDGNCWMTQNLKLDLSNRILTNEDSQTAWNASENAFMSIDDAWTTDNTIAMFSTGPTKIAEGGENYNPEYGFYYSWCAATAGTCNGLPAVNANAPGSICPKGWQLPAEIEYTMLLETVSSPIAIDGISGRNISSVFFPFSGRMDVAGLTNAGTSGYFWTNRASSSTGARSLNNDYEIAMVGAAGFAKSSGRSVRCLAPGSMSIYPSTVSVTVPKVLSIDAISDDLVLEADPNKVTTGTISATVSANTTYAVQLSANKTSLTNSQNPEDTEITSSNSIPASTNVQAKTNAWGILNQDNSTYSAITTNPTTYYNTEEYNEEAQSTKHTFDIGVSISPTLPAGEYSTTVTITAVNN